MKKITYSFILCVLSLWTMTSCNDENQIINEEGEKTESPVINTKVIDYIKNFAAKANEGSITTKAALDLEVTNINKKTYSFSLGETKTRGSIENDSVEVYTVEFKKGEQKGFSIATDDDRIRQVFAYTENGVLEDTIFNDGLKMFLSAIPHYCKQQLKEYYTPKTRTGKVLTHMTIQNFVPTQWGQRAPYNNSCPIGCGSNGAEHKLLGCGPVALAQAIAYYGKLGLTTKAWPYSDFANQAYLYNNGSYASTKAGEFSYKVAVLCSANFGCDATSVRFKNCLNSLNTYGISYNYHDGNLRLNDAWNTIVKKNIVVACGSTKKVGHVWLYTGAMAYVDINNNNAFDSIIALYANWGWNGIDDGWYYNGQWENPATQGYSFYRNNEQIYITQIK